MLSPSTIYVTIHYTVPQHYTGHYTLYCPPALYKSLLYCPPSLYRSLYNILSSSTALYRLLYTILSPRIIQVTIHSAVPQNYTGHYTLYCLPAVYRSLYPVLSLYCPPALYRSLYFILSPSSKQVFIHYTFSEQYKSHYKIYCLRALYR